MAKKGFTLIELMVVIAIIGLLATVVANFDFNKKTDIEKRDRFVQKIESLLHTSKLTMLSGKGINVTGMSTGIINPTSSRIRFDTNTIGLYYYSGSTIIGTGEVMKKPFYSEDGYTLTGIYWQDKDTTTHSGSFPIEIIFDTSGNISFTGGISETGIVLWMDVSYRAAHKGVEFDRRFGKITVK